MNLVTRAADKIARTVSRLTPPDRQKSVLGGFYSGLTRLDGLLCGAFSAWLRLAALLSTRMHGGVWIIANTRRRRRLQAEPGGGVREQPPAVLVRIAISRHEARSQRATASMSLASNSRFNTGVRNLTPCLWRHLLKNYD